MRAALAHHDEPCVRMTVGDLGERLDQDRLRLARLDDPEADHERALGRKPEPFPRSSTWDAREVRVDRIELDPPRQRVHRFRIYVRCIKPARRLRRIEGRGRVAQCVDQPLVRVVVALMLKPHLGPPGLRFEALV